MKRTGNIPVPGAEIVVELPENRTKKVGCLAQLIIKEILYFPQFKVGALVVSYVGSCTVMIVSARHKLPIEKMNKSEKQAILNLLYQIL